MREQDSECFWQLRPVYPTIFFQQNYARFKLTKQDTPALQNLSFKALNIYFNEIYPRYPILSYEVI